MTNQVRHGIIRACCNGIPGARCARERLYPHCEPVCQGAGVNGFHARRAPEFRARLDHELIHFLSILVIGAKFLGNRLQRRIELNETVLDRRMLVVTLETSLLRIGTRRLTGLIKIEIGPLVREMCRVFDFHAHAHEVSLKIANLVDLPLLQACAYYDHEHEYYRQISGL